MNSQPHYTIDASDRTDDVNVAVVAGCVRVIQVFDVIVVTEDQARQLRAALNEILGD